MNLMDLVPVDWIPKAAGCGYPLHEGCAVDGPERITLGMAFSVFLLIIFFSIKEKGIGGFRQGVDLPSLPLVSLRSPSRGSSSR